MVRISNRMSLFDSNTIRILLLQTLLKMILINNKLLFLIVDLFYTRVAPSKTFDVLKEDFDYYLIILVLAGLLVASYITKKLASQKAQKQAWK